MLVIMSNCLHTLLLPGKVWIKHKKYEVCTVGGSTNDYDGVGGLKGFKWASLIIHFKVGKVEKGVY